MMHPKEVEGINNGDVDNSYVDLQCPSCFVISSSEEDFYGHECKEQEEY